MRRFLILLAALLPLTGALLVSDADARLGGARSMGSRGTHSYFAPPSTRLSPNSTQPFQRSQTPSGTYGQSGYGAAGLGAGMGAGSMFGRHPFMTGMLGGLVGAGIGGLLFGGGFFHPGLGFGGMFGTLIQLLILFFVVRWLFRRFFSNRMAGGGMMGPRPAFNAGSAGPRPGAFAGIAGGMGDGGSNSAPLQLSNEDFRAFEQCFLYVQEAWDNQDLGAIGRAATPEMMGYFREQLNALQRQGLRNRISDIRIEGMELSEAWSESGMDYGTVAMRFSMLDVTVDGSGRIVDGSATTRSLATEVWTFLRARNSHWVLSGIQQTR